jgi:HSP20 family molecular chaperone IbpA
MTNLIEDTIQKVEGLYQSLIGRPMPPPHGPYSPVPPEADPLAHVEAQLAKLADLVATQLQPQHGLGPSFSWSPPVSLWEDHADLVIEFELAGIAKRDIEVSTLNAQVTISGIRKEPPGALRMWVNERSLGRFRRSVLLPPDVNATTMRTTFENGVLQLRFSRTSSAASGEGPATDQN